MVASVLDLLNLLGVRQSPKGAGRPGAPRMPRAKAKVRGICAMTGGGCPRVRMAPDGDPHRTDIPEAKEKEKENEEKEDGWLGEHSEDEDFENEDEIPHSGETPELLNEDAYWRHRVALTSAPEGVVGLPISGVPGLPTPNGDPSPLVTVQATTASGGHRADKEHSEGSSSCDIGDFEEFDDAESDVAQAGFT